MTLDKRYYIDSGHDGVLDGPDLDTGKAGVDALITDLQSAKRIAVVLHGGLVSKHDALWSAEKMLPAFLAADVRPIFMVWHSGLLESLGNLLKDVWNEGLYDRLIKKLLQHVAAKVGGEILAAGRRDARGLPSLPDEIATGREYKKRELHQEPFGTLQPVANLTPPVGGGGEPTPRRPPVGSTLQPGSRGSSSVSRSTGSRPGGRSNPLRHDRSSSETDPRKPGTFP